MFGGTGTSQRSAARHALDRSAECALRELPDLVTTFDATGSIEFTTQSSLELLGRAPEQLVGHRVCEYLADDDRRNASIWMAHALRGSDVPELTHQLARADGSLGWFETRIRAIQRADRMPAVVAVSRDITARAVLERQLAPQTDVWAEIVDLVREGVLVLDDHGTVLAANQVAADLLLLDRDELCGSPVREHLAVLDDDVESPGESIRPLSPSILRASGDADVRLASRRGDPPVVLWGRTVTLPTHPFRRVSDRIALLLESATSGGHAPAGARPGNDLSPREIEVLGLLAEGMDLRAIACRLGISIHTVRAYVKAILKKLDVRTQLQAVVFAARTGMVDLS